jgi:hypothetical protein
MNARETIGALVGGFIKGVVIAIVASFVLVFLMRGCVELLEAHEPIDVRINENDRTIGGLDWPGEYDPLIDTHLMTTDIELENAIIDIESAIKDIEIMMWDPTSYMHCLDYNTEVYRRAAEAGDTGLELSPQFEILLKDCWKLTP